MSRFHHLILVVSAATIWPLRSIITKYFHNNNYNNRCETAIVHWIVRSHSAYRFSFIMLYLSCLFLILFNSLYPPSACYLDGHNLSIVVPDWSMFPRVTAVHWIKSYIFVLFAYWAVYWYAECWLHLLPAYHMVICFCYLSFYFIGVFYCELCYIVIV